MMRIYCNVILVAVLMAMMLVATGCRSTGNRTKPEPGVTLLSKTCTESGWRQVNIAVAGLSRQMLVRQPAGTWRKGIILVMHGGGGSAAHFCSGGRLVGPQVSFAEQAVARGFAVIALDATNDLVTDAMGRTCGKRFDFSVLPRENLDLPFIRRIFDEWIPANRPAHSSQHVFITGLSTGGYMTTRAATEFASQVTAFAPIAAGDPYGTDTICDTSLSKRTSAKGILIDRETRRQIVEDNACQSRAYPTESRWPTSDNKTVFRQFHHEKDGIVDLSCMHKANRQLVAHGFRDAGPFIIPSRGRKKALNHLWLERYNRPVLDFFGEF